MNIAVIKTGGKQYKVKVGDKINVEKISIAKDSVNKDLDSKKITKKPEIKQTIEFDDILNGKKVKAEIIENGKEKKVMVVKFRPKKRYMRTKGHRQDYSKIEIKEIK